jgi:hypothetical protein
MNIDSWIIINDYNFITWVTFEWNNLNSLDSDLLNLDKHEFNNSPTNYIKSMHAQIVKNP